MSLLSPERLDAALFPGALRLQLSRRRQVAMERSGEPLLASLSALLQEAGERELKGKAVSLVTSDNLGVFAVLPWQESLRSQDELSVYATACFERQGIALDERWVLHAEFKEFGRAGLAFALPRDWIEELVSLLTMHGLQLHRVLPVTAACFWRSDRLPREGHAIMLLRESERVSVLVYDPGGLRGIDVEVVTSLEEEAISRLLRRTASFYDEVRSVRCWSCMADPEALVPASVADCFPDAAVTTVSHDAWALK